MKTKWGTAKIIKGYYQITSGKLGNNGKKLHRLIWEDFWGTEIPKGYIIHHKNGNKLDNCILNLQLMRKKEHDSFHSRGCNNVMYGKRHNIETMLKMSNAQNNTSGYFRVSKVKDKRVKQSFIWRYAYYDENGKKKYFESVDLKKLEKKVKANKLIWRRL